MHKKKSTTRVQSDSMLEADDEMSEEEAADRGLLAQVAHTLPHKTVRYLLCAAGLHPVVKGLYVSGELVLPRFEG